MIELIIYYTWPSYLLRALTPNATTLLVLIQIKYSIYKAYISLYIQVPILLLPIR